jgi:hypothetical protein
MAMNIGPPIQGSAAQAAARDEVDFCMPARSSPQPLWAAKLIWIKDERVGGAAMTSKRAAMLKTYTLYLRDHGAEARFEPALCQSDADAMAKARALLAAHPECFAIDVCFGDDRLFRIGRSEA